MQVRRIEPLPVGGSHAGPPEPMVRVAGTQPGDKKGTSNCFAVSFQSPVPLPAAICCVTAAVPIRLFHTLPCSHVELAGTVRREHSHRRKGRVCRCHVFSNSGIGLQGGTVIQMVLRRLSTRQHPGKVLQISKRTTYLPAATAETWRDRTIPSQDCKATS